MTIKFARDSEGYIKTKQGCQTPGCDHPNWHICLVGKEDRFNEALRKRKTSSVMSDEQKLAISESQKIRLEKIRRERAILDAKIVARYREETIGSAQLAEEFKVSKTRVLKALKEAADRGEVVMRKRGHTISRGAK